MPKFTATLNLPQYSSAPSSPANGDVYYNTTDAKAYARVNGTWVEIGGAGGSGAGSVYQTTPPSSPTIGQIWIDSDADVVAQDDERYPSVFMLMGG